MNTVSEVIEKKRLVLQFGVVDAILKPVDPMTLASKAQKIWERYHD